MFLGSQDEKTIIPVVFRISGMLVGLKERNIY
jgi:hypothetical protein